LIKSLLDNGATIKEIDKKEQLEEGKILFDEYSMTFIPAIEALHRSFYGKTLILQAGEIILSKISRKSRKK